MFAKWIPNLKGQLVCSNCKKPFAEGERCPNCGAKIIQKVEDEIVIEYGGGIKVKHTNNGIYVSNDYGETYERMGSKNGK